MWKDLPQGSEDSGMKRNMAVVGRRGERSKDRSGSCRKDHWRTSTSSVELLGSEGFLQQGIDERVGGKDCGHRAERGDT